MGKRWLEFLLSIATLVSAAISIAILFRKAREIELASSEKKVSGKSKLGRIFYGIKKHCADEIKIVAFVIIIALVLSLVACFTTFDVPEPKSRGTTSPLVNSAQLSKTPMPTFANTSQVDSIPSSTPSSTPVYETKYLCELDPIIEKTGAFFDTSWDKFDDLIVGMDTILYGIGIRIPEKDQMIYLKKSSNKRVTHNEFIEYSLGNNYDVLEFEYGIDHSSFEQLETVAPACLCKIVIQDVPSGGFVSDSDNILFDSGWFNYRLARRFVSVMLSNVEAIRITAYWEFDVDPSKDASFKLVLIDPVLLYLE